VFRTTWCKWSR